MTDEQIDKVAAGIVGYEFCFPCFTVSHEQLRQFARAIIAASITAQPGARSPMFRRDPETGEVLSVDTTTTPQPTQERPQKDPGACPTCGLYPGQTCSRQPCLRP